MRNKPEADSAYKAAAAPPPYTPGAGSRRTDVLPSTLPLGTGEWPLAGEGQPLVFLRRAIHFVGKWTSTPRRRRVHAFVLLYIKQGRGELTVNNATIPINGQLLLLLAPGMHVVERADSLADWNVHYIAFKLMSPVRESGGWMLEELDQSSFPRGGEMSVTDMPAIERLIERLREGDDVDGGLLHWKRQLVLAELLYTILLEQKAQQSPYSAPDAVRRCAAYIDRHYADNIRMDKLASWCGLHPSTFSRHFKQTIGMLPSDYLMHARIEAAKTILPGSAPLREVARRVGFCDEYYFSRMFKKVAGVSPSVYIRTAGERQQGKERNGRVLKPVNVAVTYVDEVDHLISLGLLPVAVPADHGADGEEAVIPYLKPYIAHLPHIGCEQSINMELLRKLSPELIIAGRFMQSWGVTGLGDIAPTHYYMWEVDWRNVHRQLAAALGREAHAEQNIAQFDRLVRSGRDRMFPVCARKTFVFLESTREGVRVSPYMSNGGWLLYQQMGLTPAPIVSVNGWQHFVTPEEAASIQADYLFVGQRSGALDVHHGLLREPGMQRFGPRLIELPRYPWGKGGPIAFSQGVKLILSHFAKFHK
jgi:AraC-like DNA-binding protein/ABC-type Fe3+-hydroxamate transport system substrate-binding protein